VVDNPRSSHDDIRRNNNKNPNGNYWLKNTKQTRASMIPGSGGGGSPSPGRPKRSVSDHFTLACRFLSRITRIG